MTLTEKRGHAAKLRAEGFLLREIAELMGRPVQTVSSWVSDPDGAKLRARKQSYSGVCVECGAATSGSNGRAKAPKRCQSCHQRFTSENKVWTCEAIIEAIRYYAARYGHPPSARDWNPSMARTDFRDDIAERFYDDGWPPATCVQREFGSWNAGIREAGFEPLSGGHKYVDQEPHVPVHGTLNEYVAHRCRCSECRAANAARARKKYARKKAAA